MDEHLSSIKLGILFGLLLATLIAGLAPIPCLLRPTSRVKTIISFCNCFAGGVFLATFLLHMLPEATEVLDEALAAYGIDNHYPFSEFLVAVGFFVILVAELTAHRLYHPAATTTSGGQKASDRGVESAASGEHRRSNEEAPLIAQDGRDARRTLSSSAFDTSVEHILHDTEASILSSLVFLLALGLHSVFEGLAIGLQDSVTDVVEVFIGVVLHKCVIVLSFSLSLVYRRISTCRIVIYVIFLAAMSPIGIAVGMATQADSPASIMANGVLQSIAAGTFLFIVFFEILPDELLPHDADGNVLLKTLVLILGFGLMSGLQFLDHD